MSTLQPLEGGSFYLSEISPKDKSWDQHRASADQVKELYKLTEFFRYSKRIDECSKWLLFALKAGDEGELKLKLQEAKFCRVRHCSVCQWRRSLMWRARFFQALPRIDEAYPTGRWIFLTLTVKTCPIKELRDTLTLMNKAWNLLTKRREFSVLGFIKSVEVTRSADGYAHPHFHCLLFVPAGYFSHGYISQAKWTDLWQSCLKIQYQPVVHVVSVKAKQKAGAVDKKAGLLAAVCETLKYSVKEDDLVADPLWLEELTSQLHKTKAISVGGVLKEYLSEQEPEDLINAGIEDEEETSEDDPKLIFDWAETIRRYKKK
jgi:plasmid rolling circle replication initiator protein Rep